MKSIGIFYGFLYAQEFAEAAELNRTRKGKFDRMNRMNKMPNLGDRAGWKSLVAAAASNPGADKVTRL
ncbi:MAG TPA: hypothetical protein VHH88_09250, partial [Verrucomicrobiae bacterium]|nr:hypothetical protein [Verrucomicrobiae bacterium]